MFMDQSLDSVLSKLGDFGKYQRVIFSLVCVAVIFDSAVHLAFVFTAKDVAYRCEVPGCDTTSPEYIPSWLPNAVPYRNNYPSKCQRYKPLNLTTNQACSPMAFNSNETVDCDKFFFASEDTTILHDFNIYCEDNIWKLTLIGTLNNVGQFIGLGISGILSDRYGRKNTMIWGLVSCGLAGISKGFTNSYIAFVVLELLESALGSGTYSCGFILGVELVGPEKRVLSGILISCCYTIGEILIAAVSWWTRSWRLTIIITYGPTLLVLSYLWLIPESVRWLLAKERYTEAKYILRKAAKVNGKTISEDTLEKLTICDQMLTDIPKFTLLQVFKSGPLVLRFTNSCICWMTCVFLFYGLTLNSVTLAGNSYLDFIFTSLIELPAYFFTYVIVDRIGRRLSLSGSFFLTGVSCGAFIFISKDTYWLQLTMYLLGKFGATMAFAVCYIISSEMFPTPLRHSLMAVCSAIGRIGSMVAPQMPLLAAVWNPLPLILFTAMSSIAGILALFFPETLNTSLPDTIVEAENIGKKRNKNRNKI